MKEHSFFPTVSLEANINLLSKKDNSLNVLCLTKTVNIKQQHPKSHASNYMLNILDTRFHKYKTRFKVEIMDNYIDTKEIIFILNL